MNQPRDAAGELSDGEERAEARDDQHDALDRLSAALVEIRRFVARSGWDQPSRLFALVPTAELLAAEPALGDQLVVNTADQLSSVEQDDFHPGSDLLEGWPRSGGPTPLRGPRSPPSAPSCPRTWRTRFPMILTRPRNSSQRTPATRRSGWSLASCVTAPTTVWHGWRASRMTYLPGTILFRR